MEEAAREHWDAPTDIVKRLIPSKNAMDEAQQRYHEHLAIAHRH